MESAVEPQEKQGPATGSVTFLDPEASGSTNEAAWHKPVQPPSRQTSEDKQEWATSPTSHFRKLEKLLEERTQRLEQKLEVMHQLLLKQEKDGTSSFEKSQILKLRRQRSAVNESTKHWLAMSDEERRDQEEREQVTRAMLRAGSRRSLVSMPAMMTSRTTVSDAESESDHTHGWREKHGGKASRTQVEELKPNQKVGHTTQPSSRCLGLKMGTDTQPSSRSLGLKMGTDSDSDGEGQEQRDQLAETVRNHSTGNHLDGMESSSNLGSEEVYSMHSRFWMPATRSMTSNSMITRGMTRGLSVLMPQFWSKVANRSKRAEQIWTFFEEPESTWAATVYDKVTFVLIMMATIIPVMQTLPTKPLSNAAFFAVSTVTDLLFLAELAVRFLVTPSASVFFFGFYNMLDLAIIGPFILRIVAYESLGTDQGDITPAESILLCVVPVMRMVKALHSLPNFILLWSTLRSATGAMPVPLFMLLLIVLTFSSALYVVEPRDNIISMPHAMWLVIVTISTVGYGDLYPVTDMGRVITMFLIIGGLLFMAMPIAIVGAAFLETWKNRTRILAVGRIHSRLSQWGYTEEDLKLMFKTFDSDYNNELDVNEFTRMVETMRLGLDKEQVVRLFSVFDADGSGGLDMDEFVDGIGLNKQGQLFIIF